MKKIYFLFLIVFMNGCSNFDKKENDFNIFIEILRKESNRHQDPYSWHWEALRIILADNNVLLEKAITSELELCYYSIKDKIKDDDVLLKMAVIGFHKEYILYHKIVDVVSIQKRCFGIEIFSKIEEATKKYLNDYYFNILKDVPTEYDKSEFIQGMYLIHEEEFIIYHYWPTIKDVYSRIAFNNFMSN